MSKEIRTVLGAFPEDDPEATVGFAAPLVDLRDLIKVLKDIRSELHAIGHVLNRKPPR